MNFGTYVTAGDTLDLSAFWITINMKELVKFLQSNTHITELRLPRYPISNNDMKVLANSSCLNRAERLTLCCNDINDEGIKALANSPHLTKLENLELDQNKIGDEGAEALANSPYLTELKKLSLRGNEVGGKGVEALVRSQVPKIDLGLKASPFMNSYRKNILTIKL